MYYIHMFLFQVQNIKFNSEIADVSANRRLVVMAFKEKLAAFDACNLVTKNLILKLG